VYATTGPRVTLRFFGGFDFERGDTEAQDLAAVGYRKGVPMGGDLKGTDGGAPTFLVAALKDPQGANLDRVQIVKGWHNADGSTAEMVYDVALSGDRKNGTVPVGNTVDLKTGKYSNTIGANEFTVVWKDPDFDASLRAFYYVRVLEIPTPRWTAYDAKYYGLDVGDEVEMVHQERAYTSPIWYTP